MDTTPFPSTASHWQASVAISGTWPGLTGFPSAAPICAVVNIAQYSIAALSFGAALDAEADTASADDDVRAAGAAEPEQPGTAQRSATMTAQRTRPAELAIYHSP